MRLERDSGKAVASEGNHLTAIERAFQLADQGMENGEIRRTLAREGLDHHQISGMSLLQQLMGRRNAALGKLRPANAPKPPPLPKALSDTQKGSPVTAVRPKVLERANTAMADKIAPANKSASSKKKFKKVRHFAVTLDPVAGGEQVSYWVSSTSKNGAIKKAEQLLGKPAKVLEVRETH